MTVTSFTEKYRSRPIEHDLILLLMGGFLAVDSLVGIIEIYMGVHVKVSLIYKTPVLLLILLVLGMRNMRFVSLMCLTFLTLLVGPVITLVYDTHATAFIHDFTYILKLCSPLIYYQYFMLAYSEIPERMNRFVPLVLKANYLVLVVNIFLGVLGLGYASYNSSEGRVGVNGFFGAGNELGAVFVVLSAIVLASAYRHSTQRYLIAASLTILAGLLISTKTSVLSSVMIAFLLPVFIQGKRYFYPTRLKIALSVVLFVCITSAIYLAVDLLKDAGLWKRVVWLYEEHGLLRVIFSSRNDYTAQLWEIFVDGSPINWFFGLTTSSLYTYWLPIKPLAEIDPVDTLITFGFTGLTVAVLIHLSLIRIAWKSARNNPSPHSSATLLAVLMLMALACFSGHIWYSGMLGPFLGLIVASSSAAAAKSEPQNI